MRKYVLKFSLVTVLFIVAHFAILLVLRAPITAEYWVREMIVVKRALAAEITKPKIVLVGGSYLLFGVDARAIEHELNMPTVNFGLHAAMRLGWLLSEADRVSFAGDVLVVALEHPLYSCGSLMLTKWQVRSMLAWYLESVSWRERISVIVSGAAVVDIPALVGEHLIAVRDLWLRPGLVADRVAARASMSEIFERYRSGNFKLPKFVYSAFNLDEWGSMQNTAGSYHHLLKDRPVPTVVPNGVCPEVRIMLKDFVEKQNGKSVRVLFSYAPYVVDDPAVAPRWEAEDKKFRADLANIGGKVVGRREDLFLPRHLFFDTWYHLNEEGRNLNTQNLIGVLREQE